MFGSSNKQGFIDLPNKSRTSVLTAWVTTLFYLTTESQNIDSHEFDVECLAVACLKFSKGFTIQRMEHKLILKKTAKKSVTFLSKISIRSDLEKN